MSDWEPLEPVERPRPEQAGWALQLTVTVTLQPTTSAGEPFLVHTAVLVDGEPRWLERFEQRYDGVSDAAEDLRDALREVLGVNEDGTLDPFWSLPAWAR